VISLEIDKYVGLTRAAEMQSGHQNYSSTICQGKFKVEEPGSGGRRNVNEQDIRRIGTTLAYASDI